MILESKVAYGDAITNVEAVAGEYVLIYTNTGSNNTTSDLTWGDKTFSWQRHLWIASDTTNTFIFPKEYFSLTSYIGYIKFPGLTEEPLLAASNGETFTTDDTRDYILLTAYSDTSSSGNNLGNSITLIANNGMYVYLLAPNTQYQLKTFSGNAAQRNLVYSIPKGILPRYSNKESLSGLKTGDKILYNKDCSIDFNGYKVLVELYGSGSKRGTSVATSYRCSRNGYGGYTKVVLDTSTFDSSLYFSQSGGSSLCYGNSYDAYKRIIVAGDAGERGYYARGGNGGGSTGGRGGVGGNAADTSYNNGATGGTQTAGGQYSGQSSTKGTFTTVGLGKDWNSTYYTGDGGYGWYCGGGGYMSSSSYEYSSGGGSGFVIGQTTTTYPSGYLNGDTALISTLEGSVSEPELVQGVTMDINQKMIVTILETGEDGPTQSIIQYYNGTEFIDTHIKYYNGTEFVDCDAYVYNGTEFEKI